MKICETHFNQLQAEICRRGLGDFVKPPTEAATNYQRIAALQLEPAQDNFCPLFYAQVLLYNQMIHATGGACLSYKPEPWQEPHQCPVCQAEAHDKTDWIAGAVEESAKFIRELPAKARPPFKSGCQVIAETIAELANVQPWKDQTGAEWTHGELERAANCYLQANQLLASGIELEQVTQQAAARWPFQRQAFTPSTSISYNLAQAGALIALELGRINRAERDAKLKPET